MSKASLPQGPDMWYLTFYGNKVPIYQTPISNFLFFKFTSHFCNCGAKPIYRVWLEWCILFRPSSIWMGIIFTSNLYTCINGVSFLLKKYMNRYNVKKIIWIGTNYNFHNDKYMNGSVLFWFCLAYEWSGVRCTSVPIKSTPPPSKSWVYGSTIMWLSTGICGGKMSKQHWTFQQQSSTLQWCWKIQHQKEMLCLLGRCPILTRMGLLSILSFCSGIC